jgi:cold shock CspA family protein
MPRALKAKDVVRITPAREGGTYQLEIEDEAGRRVLFELTSNQALVLADRLDGLLADEEEELHPRSGVVSQSSPPASAGQGSLGTVKWYNTTKGFGFVTPDAGGEELFVHRSVLEQARLTELAEGTRVRIEVGEGKRGPQVRAIELA